MCREKRRGSDHLVTDRERIVRSVIKRTDDKGELWIYTSGQEKVYSEWISRGIVRWGSVGLQTEGGETWIRGEGHVADTKM